MRIFKTKAFSRWASGQLTDAALRTAVREIGDGLVEANLGGYVYKKRIALPGRGKSSGARTVVAFRSGDRAVFMYGFAKNQQADIEKDELGAFKRLAKAYMKFSDADLDKAVKAKELVEVEDDGEEDGEEEE